MKIIHSALLSGASALLLGITAFQAASAADIDDRMIVEQSPWQVRVRALGVITRDDGNVDQIPGSNLSSSDSLVPELDISYFFTDNIAAELILGTTRSTIDVGGVGEAGKTWLLPPTLTLQYHFTDFGAFKPYIGAGINYTMFFEQKGTTVLSNMDVEDTFGAALQVGFDYMIDDHWGWNVDVKKLFLRPDWTGTLAGSGTAVSGKAKLDPWLIGTGLTYRF